MFKWGECSDAIVRTTTWIGKVGLMYPSDYGYATSGGSITDRMTCLSTYLRKWSDNSVSDCKNNDWLFDSSYQWTLSPYASSSSAYIVFYASSGGRVGIIRAGSSEGVRPVGYLLPSVGVQGGDGSSSNPFVLSN